MKAVWNNRVIAKSDNVIEIDGVYYFPLNSLNPEYFLNSTTKSRCPWKGLASYLHVAAGSQVNEDAAWYYAQDSDCPDLLRNRVAFWKGIVIKGDKDTAAVRLPVFRSLFASFF